jgi:hypothetical protein
MLPATVGRLPRAARPAIQLKVQSREGMLTGDNCLIDGDCRLTDAYSSGPTVFPSSTEIVARFIHL